MPHPRAIGAVLAAIVLAPAAGAAPQSLLDVRELTAPAVLSGLAPGDSVEWAAEVTNVSASPHGLEVGFTVDGSLADDPRDGLQLEVDLCPSAFTVVERVVADGRTVERYLCPSDVVPLGAGPAASLAPLESVRPVARGATIGVRARVVFPASAGNESEGAKAALRVVVREADGAGAGGPGTPGGSPGAAGPIAAGPGGLAVTGRDLGAALLGGLLTLVGAALLAAGRRHRREHA